MYAIMYAATSLGRKLGLRDSIFSGLRHGEYPGTKATLGPEISALAQHVKGDAAAFTGFECPEAGCTFKDPTP